MKNIHVLPTNCTITNLIVIGDKLNLIRSNYYSKSYIELHNYKAKAMYITSDEEIKEGDWIIWNKKIVKAINTAYHSSKKIILTTDQDLIKDGVQAIDDEFLQWFVKNPSCEEIEVSEDYFNPSNMVYGYNTEPYKIIIPEEEYKQTDWKSSTKALMEAYGDNPKDFPFDEPKDVILGYETSIVAQILDDVELKDLKQETLEEAAEKYSEKTASIKILVDDMMDRLVLSESSFEAGAKWQAERMYNKEEVLLLLHKRDSHNMVNPMTFNGSWLTPKEWLNNLKK